MHVHARRVQSDLEGIVTLCAISNIDRVGKKVAFAAVDRLPQKPNV